MLQLLVISCVCGWQKWVTCNHLFCTDCNLAEVEIPTPSMNPGCWGTGVPSPLTPVRHVTPRCVLCLLLVLLIGCYILAWVSIHFFFKYTMVRWEWGWFCFLKWGMKRPHPCISWLITNQVILESHLVSFNRIIDMKGQAVGNILKVSEYNVSVLVNKK